MSPTPLASWLVTLACRYSWPVSNSIGWYLATEMAKEFNSYPARSDFSKMLPTNLKTASGGAPLLCPPSFAPYPLEEATHVLTEGNSTVAPLCLCTSSHAVPCGWWVPCFSQHGFPCSLVCPPPLHSLVPGVLCDHCVGTEQTRLLSLTPDFGGLRRACGSPWPQAHR